jgi:hypothetical protein
MTVLSEIIDATGNDVKQQLKTELLDLIQGAKSESAEVIKETGEKIEKWVKMKVEGDIDADELQELLNSRKATVQQFLNTQEITAKARMEKISVGLIDLIVDKAMGVIV